ncbi:porin [Methylophilus sp. TWE2]|uniref:porin n=1 Tax=Methylophilus sp. TWE2 TaxID=1662285 RepID=UPI000670FA6D|nr:porin [Methylophilus sp. TWE2]AKR44349.1 porin [Methylophilus sp. TWE2]
MNIETINPRLRQISLYTSLALLSTQAFAEATLQRNENQFINIGIASRISFSSIKDAAPNGKNRSNDFEVEEARLYTNGKVHENVSFEFNFARNSADNRVELLDGHLGLEFNNYAHVWVGRFLPAASRASAAAPMYSTTFDFPIAELGSYQFAGRDNGAVFFGTDKSEAFKYYASATNGRQGGSNQADNLSYATRLQYNFWDTEPGFYNLASYDGKKSILSVGGSYRYQKDGAGTILNKGDSKYWNLDARLEKPLSDGAVLGAEASYYNYDNDNTGDTVLPEAKGFFVNGSYTFAEKVGIGKFQPKVIYQEFNNDTTGLDRKRVDIGVGYLIDGDSNKRIDVFYFRENRNTLPDIDGIKAIFHVAHFF